jgi:restriction system protein
MARQKSSAFEDWVMIAAKLPWWLGLLLAGASYIGLHWYAGTPVPTSSDPTKMFDVVGATMWRTLAMLGQYVVSAVFVLGAGVSVWKSRSRTKLAARVAADPTTSALNQMSWREFEQVVGEAFRQRGFKVTERGGSGPDGGVDLMIRQGSETTVVQCKQYRATQVGVAIVRELFGAMTAEGASGGMVVSLGSFTRDAQAFASGRNIQLVSGGALQRLLQDGAQAIRVPRTDRNPAIKAAVTVSLVPPVSAPVAPSCPRCGEQMKLRGAKAGANAGTSFWGCVKFPDCRGTREAAGV